MAIDTTKPIKSVTYNGVNIPLAGGGGSDDFIDFILNNFTEIPSHLLNANTIEMEDLLSSPFPKLVFFFFVDKVYGGFYMFTYNQSVDFTAPYTIPILGNDTGVVQIKRRNTYPDLLFFMDNALTSPLNFSEIMEAGFFLEV